MANKKYEALYQSISSDIQKMKDLGYEVYYNKCRPNDEDSFIPKTVMKYDRAKCTEV